MLIDTHAHVNFNDFRDDADQVIRRALDNDVMMILVGAEYRTSSRALTFANKYQKGVYAAVGLHPIHLQEQEAVGDDYKFKTLAEEFNASAYEKLASMEKVVAIGEIGLDYYHLPASLNRDEVKLTQKKAFLSQLKLAIKLKLPVIIHCREAHDDMLRILKDFRHDNSEAMPADRPWGVMHCFSGDEELAWEYFKLGLLVSFNGIITFTQYWDDFLRKIPLDKFLVETDCPFLTPVPYRGQRNEPMLVKLVAEKIAQLKGVETSVIAEATTANAVKLFGLGL